MKKVELLQNVAKMYLIKDFLKQDYKHSANRAIKNVSNFCNKIERHHTETSIDNAENDVETLTMIIDSFIQAEEKDVLYAFKNDFYGICKKHNINI